MGKRLFIRGACLAILRCGTQVGAGQAAWARQEAGRLQAQEGPHLEKAQGKRALPTPPRAFPKFKADLTAGPVITGNDNTSRVLRAYSVPGLWFMEILSFKPHNIPVKLVLVSAFYRRQNEVSERLRELPKVTQPNGDPGLLA